MIGRIRRFVDHPAVQRAVLALIVVNAIALGLETWPAAMAAAGPLITGVDRLTLGVFVIEIVLRLIAAGPRFFRSGWNLFDLVVVGIALVPAGEGFAVLRALRVLRVLRLVSAAPRMRLVVESLLGAIPGISAIVALLLLIFYVAAVMATKLFGTVAPETFGSVVRSLFTLFQVMTLEGWADIVRDLMETRPWAWVFFVPFILVVTFAVLNLFVAVIVGAMQAGHDAETVRAEEQTQADYRALVAEVRALRAELAARLPGGRPVE